MEKVLIDKPKEYQATTGELLELHYNILSLPIVGKLQRDLIMNRINQNPHFRVQKVESEQGQLVITVKVIDNPVPLLALVIGISTVLGTFFIMNSLGTVYKIIEEPAGALISTGAIVATIVGLLAIFKIGRKA